MRQQNVLMFEIRFVNLLSDTISSQGSKNILQEIFKCITFPVTTETGLPIGSELPIIPRTNVIYSCDSNIGIW